MKSVMQYVRDNNKSGVWAFINLPDQKIYLKYSRNISVSIVNEFSKVINMTHDRKGLFLDLDKIEVAIIETDFPYCDYKLILKKWFDSYTEKGYSFYNGVVNPITLTASIKIDSSLRPYVELKSSNGRNRINAGVFKTVRDAQNFIDKHYRNGVKKVVFKE